MTFTSTLSFRFQLDVLFSVCYIDMTCTLNTIVFLKNINEWK